ncbi:DUF5658 family protein [Halovenus rubra]|uniref:DUF5658 family protein n=2 Tax=Halovenus rubra TaxID=869890 RepID=A0ABD5X391_9EURY|nr:DUF5658 family protein [Halovenus rubra]
MQANMDLIEESSALDVFTTDASKEYISMVYVLVLLWGLGDVLSTYFAYAAVGTAAGETNPWMALLLSHNPVLIAVVKGAVVLYVGVILLEYRNLVQRTPGWRLWLVGVVVLGVVIVLNNLIVGIIALSFTVPVSSRPLMSPDGGQRGGHPHR